MDACSVCSKKFQISSIADSKPHHTEAGRPRVCSELCRWFLEYFLGFTHGILFCYTVQKLCKNKTCAGFQPASGTCVESDLSHSYETANSKDTKSELRVKEEKALSDVEEFDCTVSFQDNSHYDNSTEVYKDVMCTKTLHREPASKTCKRDGHEIFTKKTESRNHKKLRIRPRPVNTNITDGRRKTGQRMSLRTKRNTTYQNSAKNQRQNAKRINQKQETKDMADDSQKAKIPKLLRGAIGRAKLGNSDSEVKSGSALQCEFCSKTFGAKRFLQRHLNRFHPAEVTVRCEMCGELCKNQTHLSVHLRKEHSVQGSEGEDLFHCDQCPKSFNARRGLALHKEFVHSRENPVNCKLCDLTLKNEIYLKRHMKRSHSDSIICDICGAKFKSRLGLNAHLSAHKGVKSFFCEVCGMGFVRKTSLRRHVQQHSDESFDCDSCSSSYKTFGSLSLHMLQIHQRGAYFENRLKSMEKLGYVVNKEAVQRHLNHQCVTCGENLVSGICVTHPTEYALMFKCHRCELTAEHVDDLLAHLKDHNDGTSSSSISVSFGCKVCRKVFPRKLYLNQHMKKHHPGASMSTLTMSEATLSYVCHVCGKHFQQKQYLYVHMKQHLQPRSFACSICDKKFTYKCNLKNHLTTHSEEKPFQCDVCFKLFRRKEVLNSHRLVHNPSLSPFKCHICGKGLSRKQYLKKHYQIMHPETQEQEVAPKAQPASAFPEQQQLQEADLQQLSLPLPQHHNSNQFTSL